MTVDEYIYPIIIFTHGSRGREFGSRYPVVLNGLISFSGNFPDAPQGNSESGREGEIVRCRVGIGVHQLVRLFGYSLQWQEIGFRQRLPGNRYIKI